MDPCSPLFVAPQAPRSDDSLRLRIVMISTVLGGLVTLGWALALSLFDEQVHLTGAGPGELVMGLAFLVNAAAYYLHRRLDVLCHLSAGILLAGSHSLCWLTGGLLDGAPLLVWTLLVPLAAAQFISVRAGWGWMAAMVTASIFTACLLPASANRLSQAEPLFLRFYVMANLLPSAFFITGLVVSLMRGRQAAMTALQQEHDRSESLLLNVLPAAIAQRLKSQPQSIAERFDDATILFADLVGFTTLSARVSPEDLVQLLNGLFSEFDALVEKHGLEKIKTIGDAYMAVGGLPVPQADHAQRVAGLALDMLEAVRSRQTNGGPALDVRIGINSGPVVAGVIGRKKFIYDLWGDAVNVASRMESHGVVGAIHVTAATRDKLQGDFVLEDRGTIDVKGRGPMNTWLLRSPKVSARAA